MRILRNSLFKLFSMTSTSSTSSTSSTWRKSGTLQILAVSGLAASGFLVSCGSATNEALALRSSPKFSYDGCRYLNPEACPENVTDFSGKITTQKIEDVCKPESNKNDSQFACFDGKILTNISWATEEYVKNRSDSNVKYNCKYVVPKSTYLGELPRIVEKQKIVDAGLAVRGCAKFDLSSTDGLGEKNCPAMYTMANNSCVLRALSSQSLMGAEEISLLLEQKDDYLVGVNGGGKRSCLVLNQDELLRKLLVALEKNKISYSPKQEFLCNAGTSGSKLK